MNWMDAYQRKTVTADQAVSHIESGQRVFLTGNCSVPKQILAALVKRAHVLNDVEMVQVLTFGPDDYVAPELEGHLRVNSLFISDNIRQAVNEGRADFTPCFLSEIPGLFLRRHLPLDVAVIHVTPPDEHGFCSFGVEVSVTKPAAQAARIVIAEVNAQMPRTLGDSFIHVSRLNCIVPVNYPVAELPQGGEGADPISEKIASYIAELIPDGATMQMGIGAIPDAVLNFLGDKRDLGIHSEMFSDGVVRLVEKGVITNSRKTLHPGKIVVGFILGTQALYSWADDNPLCEFHRQEYVNDPFVIAQNDKMVAINSAIEVDLTGQVCADSIGPKLFSGVGGQVDFVYGASRSKGGVPVIALPSTATLRDGTLVSRIACMLKQGAGVVTSRNHVHFVVTEYGVASLYGKTIRQRARELIKIAHPDFRVDLEKQAKALNYM